MAAKEILFYKYHGTGNDFVLIDGRDGFPGERGSAERASLAQSICDRHFGVGSDGLIILENEEGMDFYMDFYNPDGSQSFCGNGSRCATQFFRDLGGTSDQPQFKAIDGIHRATFTTLGVKVNMRDVQGRESIQNDSLINTGSPHYIVAFEEEPGEDWIDLARSIRYSERFKAQGVNVNFTWPNEQGLCMRTYERGVEDETLSCGTGVTAAALDASLRYGMDSPLKVLTRGGELRVHFEREGETSWKSIWLEGAAVFVFKGYWTWN